MNTETLSVGMERLGERLRDLTIEERLTGKMRMETWQKGEAYHVH